MTVHTEGEWDVAHILEGDDPLNANGEWDDDVAPWTLGTQIPTREETLADAESGDSLAMVTLAKDAENTGDLATARDWYRRAADHGNSEAMHTLGFIAEWNGDTATARDWYRRAADHGNCDATNSLGLVAAQEGDYATARHWWATAADHGDTGAMYNLGVLASEDGDLATALHWYQRAAEHGHTRAMWNVGFMTSQDGDRATALHWYQQAADHGHTDAMNNLGVLASKDGDRATALHWYQQAADHGHTGAMWSLGYTATQGGNTATARHWYELAARHGHTGAMWRLGRMAEQNGDTATAHAWYMRAARHGHTSAMWSLGRMAENNGDTATAHVWYQRADDQGQGFAMLKDDYQAGQYSATATATAQNQPAAHLNRIDARIRFDGWAPRTITVDPAAAALARISNADQPGADEPTTAFLEELVSEGFGALVATWEFVTPSLRRWQEARFLRPAAPPRWASLAWACAARVDVLDRPGSTIGSKEATQEPDDELQPVPVERLCPRRLRAFLAGAVSLADQGTPIGSTEAMRLLDQADCPNHIRDTERMDRPQDAVVMDLAEAIDQGQLKIDGRHLVVTPDTRTELGRLQRAAGPIDTVQVSGPPLLGRPLRQWQRQALEAWAAHGRRGVVEAITGAGKTEVGLAAAYDGLRQGLTVVIIVPTQVLLHQWAKRAETMLRGTGHRVRRLGDGHSDHGRAGDLLIAVVNSFARQVLDGIYNRHEVLLIADECHNWRPTSTGHGAALSPSFRYRLGLTATLDDESRAHYYSGSVYCLEYRHALKAGVVSPYRLLMLGATLNSSEQAHFDKCQDRMGQAEVELTDASAALTRLRGRFPLFQAEVHRIAENEHHHLRAPAQAWVDGYDGCIKVMATMAGKSRCVSALDDTLKTSNGSLVFTMFKNPAKKIYGLLQEHGVPAEVLDGDTPQHVRDWILGQLKAGTIKTIVAPRILDEGVDVPDADTAVIVSMSRKRRQTIQRLGRVLRLKPAEARPPVLALLYVSGGLDDPDTGRSAELVSELQDNARLSQAITGQPAILRRVVSTEADEHEARAEIAEFLAPPQSRVDATGISRPWLDRTQSPEGSPPGLRPSGPGYPPAESVATPPRGLERAGAASDTGGTGPT